MTLVALQWYSKVQLYKVMRLAFFLPCGEYHELGDKAWRGSCCDIIWWRMMGVPCCTCKRFSKRQDSLAVKDAACSGLLT